MAKKNIDITKTGKPTYKDLQEVNKLDKTEFSPEILEAADMLNSAYLISAENNVLSPSDLTFSPKEFRSEALERGFQKYGDYFGNDNDDPESIGLQDINDTYDLRGLNQGLGEEWHMVH